jgi:hypothetical protein
MALLAGLLTGLAVQAQAQALDAPLAGAPVAGLQPDRRPAAAPRLAAVVADAALKQRRLAGISQPWPGNVERIAEQGTWFSPMFAPGMTGRYDLRGLHPPSVAGRP